MRHVIGLLAALFMSAAFGAQAVIEVPGAQKVRDAIQSGSARDRLARQSAAAFVLGNVVRVQAGERLKSGGLTAAETARIAELEALRDAADRDIEATLPANCRNGANCDERYAFNRCMSAYQLSPAFYRAVYDRFFNAEAQKALSPKLTNAGTVWKDAIGMAPNSHPLASLPAPSKECAGGGAAVASGAGAGAGAVSPGTTAPAVTVRAKEHVESVQRAKAAGIDTTVFGLKLGEAVTLPACPSGGFFGAAEVTETCQRPQTVLDSDAASAMANEVTGQQVLVTYEISINLPRARCPDWFDIDCLFYGHLVDGRLVSVFVHPRGLGKQEQVAAVLKQKYKGCVLNGWYEFKNDVSGDQARGMDLTCKQAGITVMFKGYTGGGNPGNGGLLIETDAMTRQRNAAEKARVGEKQTL
jgi:hypothetical protein